jgi:hypothetical protein
VLVPHVLPILLSLLVNATTPLMELALLATSARIEPARTALLVVAAALMLPLVYHVLSEVIL